ncbi:hypothetical protein TorRG33x02_013980 [Trema orientale]|uniref:Uncharacterized protein n=1 Tax=Trema orientale TaxID=63057 RepID=A0A2P5FXA8_TREOI|nr:hypothetical protein TorRG33x02_013980 [Trema orientale]
MDISYCSDKSEECQDVSSLGCLQSSITENHRCLDSFDSHLVNELEDTLARTLHVKEVQRVWDDVSNLKERDECQSHHVDKPKCSNKTLNKCSSFPFHADKEDEEPGAALKGLFPEDPSRNAYTRSISLPTPLKLVSALKGSREKHGVPLKKLNVTWAPDVYDPVPTSLSHTVTGGKKQYKSKNNKKNWKNGKKGQKGNSSRGGGGKDKKQRSKASGNSSGYNKSIDTRERLTEPNDEFNDLTVGSPDSQPYCGTSFLKNSHTKMHYPVAEAL